MRLSLSPRLRECCRYIPKGVRLADIGCDHGYLAIDLLKRGIADSVIAADIREGPLNSAVTNAQKFGVSSHISFYLSDGLLSVPRDFDFMVCAGMGAETMISILKAAPWIQSKQYQLVLQCQTKTHLLRKYLSETGWEIARESIVRDGHFLYTVILAQWNPAYPPLSPGETYLSPALLTHPGADLTEYANRIRGGVQQAVEGRGAENVPYMAQAYHELSALRLPYLSKETPQ